MGLVKANLVTLLILAYGFLRSHLRESAWTQAPDLHGYLLGALALHGMDVLAMGAIALYVLANFPRPAWVARGFALAVVAASLISSGRAARPIVADLQAPQRLEAAIVRKLPNQVVVLQRHPRDPATASWRLPNDQQFRRAPLERAIEFQTAPHLGVAFVTGVLD